MWCRFLYLRAGTEELVERLAGRNGHFFPAALIDSQLAALEEPSADEHALTAAATEAPDHTVERLLAAWQI